MNKIRKLPPHEAQKIAAGEVVERPANILKELLENAIDAQSSKITIYIHDGGKKCIRVLDNGCGMSPDDAQLCFEQHATSKIVHIDDLSTITTFGFRGEALASIAAVSKTVLITKEADTAQGTKIEIEGNEIITHEIVPANTGTDISIHNLFYNVPARKKFLKTRETEWRQIQQLFFAFCLAHIHIDFKLYSEDKLLYNCPGTTDLQQRVTQLIDPTMAKQIIPAQHIFKNITVSGIISNQHVERYDRNMIYLFVNQRWIKDINLSRAFIKGYQQVLPPGRYPLGCIFITVDPHEVDINIHPRKEEVQLLHPQHVQRTISTMVTNALEQHLSDQLKKTVQLKQSDISEKSYPYGRSAYTPMATASFSPFNFDQFLHRQDRTIQPPTAHDPIMPISTSEYTQPDIQQAFAALPESDNIEHEYNIIGQYHKTYILIEQEDGLLLLDQHAAHERILYEQFCEQHGTITTVQLMFPQIIMVTPQDMATIAPYTDMFMSYGIELEPFGNDTLKVQSTPVQLKHLCMKEIIQETLRYIYEHPELTKDTFDHHMKHTLYALMACKAAVKAGDTLSHDHIKELIRNLYHTKNRFSCPHGRPTMWTLHLDEVKKKFKRDYRVQRDGSL